MKRLVPSRGELAVFAVLAIFCGVLVTVSRQHDTMLFFCGMPMFFICLMMGFRRSELHRQLQQSEEMESES